MTFENVQSRSFVDIGVPELELGNEKTAMSFARCRTLSSRNPPFRSPITPHLKPITHNLCPITYDL